MPLLNVLRDLDETLKLLIKEHLKADFPEFAYDDSITFESPADIDAASLTTAKVSIFLYQIVENSYLKNDDRVLYDNNHLQHRPLILDVYYLFTPYARNKETEHTILERIMTTFHDYQVLKGAVLQGGLINSGNQEIRTVSHSFSFEEINKLWERFPNKPFKLSVAYMLTPIRVPSAKEPEAVTRVTEKIIDFYSMGDPK
ncbi:MAG: DUF4255 domain-containing protein [Firmicutes bacterium]|nr:DUF4255 domain-containing protein [Bacillota bacterium]